MLSITYAEENGERPFILTRITPASKSFETTRLDLLGAFSRAEMTELGKKIREAVRNHA